MDSLLKIKLGIIIISMAGSEDLFSINFSRVSSWSLRQHRMPWSDSRVEG